MNPRINPFKMANGKVLPPEGAAFLDRTLQTPGIIQENSKVVKAFLSRGWTWGGHWRNSRDYQHFEKK